MTGGVDKGEEAVTGDEDISKVELPDNIDGRIKLPREIILIGAEGVIFIPNNGSRSGGDDDRG